MIGCFFDTHHAEWGEAELLCFEELLEEQDVDVMAWALGAEPTPERYAGPMMEALKKVDYVTISG